MRDAGRGVHAQLGLLQLRQVTRRTAASFPWPFQTTLYGTPRAKQGAVDGEPEVFVRLLGGYLRQAVQFHLDHAALVLAAIRSIDVDQSNSHFADVIADVGEQTLCPLRHALQEQTGYLVAA